MQEHILLFDFFSIKRIGTHAQQQFLYIINIMIFFTGQTNITDLHRFSKQSPINKQQNKLHLSQIQKSFLVEI